MQIAAARALSAIDDRRAIAPLTSALGTRYRALRITAASSLLNLGIIRLDGEDGRRLEVAKRDFVEALRNWPNVPEFRLNLGNYHLVHSAYQDALTEYAVAIQLDPTLPEAWYFTGQAQARLGHLDRALEAWKKVRELRPDFPNIDQLVRATEQQLKKGAPPAPSRPGPAPH